MEYAKQRMKEYRARKSALFGSAEPSLGNVATEGNKT